MLHFSFAQDFSKDIEDFTKFAKNKDFVIVVRLFGKDGDGDLKHMGARHNRRVISDVDFSFGSF